MLAEQEGKLSEMGYCIKNTFLEPSGPSTTFGEAVRRANSDPTPSSSRSASADSHTGRREESSGSTSRDAITSSGSAARVSSKDARSQVRPSDAAKQDASNEEFLLPRNFDSQDLSVAVSGAPQPSPAPGASSSAEAARAPAAGGGGLAFDSEDARLRERAAAKGLDLGDVLTRVPMDQDGRPTSIGSTQHADGTCKPCAFSEVVGGTSAGGSAPGCLEGVLCRFCHFPHASKPKIRLRPCKGRRERMKKLVTKVSAAAESALEAGLDYDVTDAQTMPEWIQQKPLLMQHVQAVVAFKVAKSKGSPLDSEEGQPDEPAELHAAAGQRGRGGPSAAASSDAMPHGLAPVPGMYRGAHAEGLAGANITRFSL